MFTFPYLVFLCTGMVALYALLASLKGVCRAKGIYFSMTLIGRAPCTVAFWHAYSNSVKISIEYGIYKKLKTLIQNTCV